MFKMVAGLVIKFLLLSLHLAFLEGDLQENKSKSVYIYFDSSSELECKLKGEEGEPYSLVKKFRKKAIKGENIEFRICESETFVFNNDNGKRKRIHRDSVAKIKFTDVEKLRLDFLNQEMEELKQAKGEKVDSTSSSDVYRFNNITFYLIEKDESGNFVQYQVRWNYIKDQY